MFGNSRVMAVHQQACKIARAQRVVTNHECVGPFRKLAENSSQPSSEVGSTSHDKHGEQQFTNSLVTKKRDSFHVTLQGVGGSDPFAPLQTNSPPNFESPTARRQLRTRSPRYTGPGSARGSWLPGMKNWFLEETLFRCLCGAIRQKHWCKSLGHLQLYWSDSTGVCSHCVDGVPETSATPKTRAFYKHRYESYGTSTTKG